MSTAPRMRSRERLVEGQLSAAAGAAPELPSQEAEAELSAQECHLATRDMSNPGQPRREVAGNGEKQGSRQSGWNQVLRLGGRGELVESRI